MTTTKLKRSGRPQHAKTKAAKKSRKAMTRYATERRRSRDAVTFESPDACWVNEPVDPLTLTGGPLGFAKAMSAAGHSVAATLSTNVATGEVGVACVWVLTAKTETTSRSWLRASWHWRDGWKTHAAILDGVNVGVTAARKALL